MKACVRMVVWFIDNVELSHDEILSMAERAH